MSAMLKPSGPLPPRVYWLRRLALLLVGVLIVVVAWAWLANGRNDSTAATGHPNRLTGAQGRTTSSPVREGDTTPTTPVRSPSGVQQPHSHPRHHQAGAGPPARHHGSRHSPSASPSTRLPAPSGKCDPQQVNLSIDVADSVEGQSNTATLVLTLPGSAGACTLRITPQSLVARVTSGPDVVWSSTDCLDALPARKVVVRHDPATIYSLSWNGRRSTGDCGPPGNVAPAGGYWFEAALIGGDPHKAYFDIRPAKRSPE
jgi:hypothetical protein